MAIEWRVIGIDEKIKHRAGAVMQQPTVKYFCKMSKFVSTYTDTDIHTLKKSPFFGCTTFWHFLRLVLSLSLSSCTYRWASWVVSDLHAFFSYIHCKGENISMVCWNADVACVWMYVCMYLYERVCACMCQFVNVFM